MTLSIFPAIIGFLGGAMIFYLANEAKAEFMFGHFGGMAFGVGMALFGLLITLKEFFRNTVDYLKS